MENKPKTWYFIKEHYIKRALNTMKVVEGKSGKEIVKLYKNCLVQYLNQRSTTAFLWRQNKSSQHKREGIRIYTGAFRISPVEALHVEENCPSLELRTIELELIPCVKWRIYCCVGIVLLDYLFP